MIEDVGMSKPKKDANKVRWDSNVNKPLPYKPTQVFKKQNKNSCTYNHRHLPQNLVVCRNDN